jgi:hypothetical protein
VPKTHTAAVKSESQITESHPLFNPDHIHTLATHCLDHFAFLNDPPKANVSYQSLTDIACHLRVSLGNLLAHPILESLCQSFYKQEKWQWLLMLQVNGDNEWMSTVPLRIIALAATAVSLLLNFKVQLTNGFTFSIAMLLKSGGLAISSRKHLKWGGLSRPTTTLISTL